MSRLHLSCVGFYRSKVADRVNPSFRLMPCAVTFLAKKLRLIWHGLCPMALIRPFVRPPFPVVRWLCLRPCGMTAHPGAYLSAEPFLFVLFYEQQIPVFILQLAHNVCALVARPPLGLLSNKKQKSSSPVMSNALVAQPPCGLLSK